MNIAPLYLLAFILDLDYLHIFLNLYTSYNIHGSHITLLDVLFGAYYTGVNVESSIEFIFF